MGAGWTGERIGRVSIHDYYALRIKKRKPRAAAPAPPDAIGLRYAAAVKRFLRAVQQETRAVVWPMLEQLNLRQDSPAVIDAGMALLFRRIFELLRTMRVEETITTIALQTNAHTRKELSRVIGIPLADVLPMGTIESFVRENVAKITQLATSQLDRVQNLVSVASVQGLRVEELRDKIVEDFGVSESYGALLARDQTLKLNGKITQERQTQAGILRYRWSSSNDARVRPEHKALDGTIQEWASPPVTSSDGRRNAPGGDYQCRCVAVPIVEDVLG